MGSLIQGPRTEFAKMFFSLLLQSKGVFLWLARDLHGQKLDRPVDVMTSADHSLIWEMTQVWTEITHVPSIKFKTWSHLKR